VHRPSWSWRCGPVNVDAVVAPRQPFYVRNLPFMALPAALMFACWTVVPVISRFQGQLWADLLVLPIGLLPFVLFGLGINDSSRPPDSTKPDWLRAEEARRQASPTHDTEV
jgi:hypothetical protein